VEGEWKDRMRSKIKIGAWQAIYRCAVEFAVRLIPQRADFFLILKV
jgi:hypothetical protein